MTRQSVTVAPIVIGQLIERELRRQERTVTWLARKINCDRRNVYNVFERTYIDTELLLRISIVLQTDFFAYYSRALQSAETQQITPPNSPFSIGQLIKEELKRQGRSVIWLAREINCDRRNIYNVFSRTTVDSELLFRISVALNTDFFILFSRSVFPDC